MAMELTVQDKVARKRIANARSDMILDEPFFGALALRLLLVEDLGCGTAWTDGKHLGYNPKFVMALKADELVTLVKHEVLHCSNGHPWRRDAREPRRFNDACDYSINPILVDAGGTLPEGGLLDDQYKGKSAEWIYDRLPAMPPQQSPQGGSGQSRGNSKSTPGQSGQRPGSTGGKGQGSKPEHNPLGEVRDAPTAGADGEAQPTEEDWRQATVQAAVLAKGQGKLPAGMDRLIGKLTKPRVDWKPAMRRFAQEAARADYSFARPNLRYVPRLYLPALQSHEVGIIAIAVDTSGSVDDVLLGQFGSEVSAVADEVRPRQIRVLYCDAEVNRQETFERDEPVTLKACGGGGTDFRPVFDEIQKWEEPPVALIYLTDLYGTHPASDPGVATLWVTPNHEHPPVPFGEVIVAE